jgi:hypothetical protein
MTPDPARCCLGKRRYRNVEHARRVARERSAKTREEIVPYVCRVCGGYHIGHRPRNQR